MIATKPFVLVAAIVANAAIMTGATAQKPVVDLANGWGPSALEISRTPSYCQKQFLSKHDAKVMNPLFAGCDSMNHLCPGLILLNRAADVTIAKQERRRILHAGKGDIEYSMRRLTKSCVVYADVMAANQRVKLLEMLLKY